jgi:hypothetical protein
MKRIALDLSALHRFVKKSEVERGIVSDENRTRAAVFPHRTPHLAKNSLQRVAFINSRSQRVVRVNPVNSQRCRLEVRALEWLYVIAKRFSAQERAVFLWVDQDRGNFQQCVRPAIEAAGLDVNDDWIKAAESIRD